MFLSNKVSVLFCSVPCTCYLAINFLYLCSRVFANGLELEPAHRVKLKKGMLNQLSVVLAEINEKIGHLTGAVIKYVFNESSFIIIHVVSPLPIPFPV